MTKKTTENRCNHERYIKATFTRDRSGTVPNRTGPDWLLFTWNYLEPVQVFTQDLSGTGPDRTRYWTCKTAGPVLDPFRTGPRTVPCKQKAYPVRKSDRIRSGPVPCKHGLKLAFKAIIYFILLQTATRSNTLRSNVTVERTVSFTRVTGHLTP